jgi:ATP-dependent protease ClpP protease subunit
MKEVLIDGDIGYSYWDDSGVTAKSVKEQLSGLEEGEDVNIIINSPGGSVYEGIVIFNLIRDCAKTHPVAVRVNCLAASMASYIALAARTVNKSAVVSVSENSIFMIHNPWSFAWGDYRELKREADYLEKLAVVYGSVHAAVSGKTEKEIRAAMDNETFYVGKEIEEAGFANAYEVISQQDETAPGGESASARDTLIINAKIAYDKTKEKAREAKIKNPAEYNSDLEKAVALFIAPKQPAAQGAKPGEKITVNLGGGSMNTPEELLAQNKELYNAVFALGEKAGLEKERARVNAHLMLGEKTGALAIAAKYIKSGVSTNDETAQAEYYAAKLDAVRLGDRNADNVGDLHTEEGAGTGAAPGTGGGADDAKLLAAFEAGYAGKDLGGKSWTE